MKDQRWRLVGIVLWLVLLLPACSKDAPTPLPGCENTPRPIVYVHGFLEAGDSFVNTAMRFTSNGYCPQYVRVFDWNTLIPNTEKNVERLADFVQEVLDETGAKKVDLVGHSAGGSLSHQYLQEHVGDVAHYVHVASFCDVAFPDELPVLVLSSDEDPVVGVCNLAGADNQDLDGADHLQAVTTPEAFAAMYRFFNAGQEPTKTRVVPEEAIALSGKVIQFGTNAPAGGSVVNVYPLDAATGERLEATPAASFTAGEEGAWGPFQADAAVHYEFEVTGENMRPFHYYRQPFLRSHVLVYLRVLPESDLLLNRLLQEMRYSDESSTLVFFSANRALYHGRDTASVDGLELVTPEMAPSPPDSASTIAVFVFDADEDGQSDGGPVAGELAEFPFMSQYDAFLDARVRRSMTLTLNGATLHVPAWKGESEGITVVVFDYDEDGL
ncbi:MAG: alpha/beta fold hydrolase [Anaerolineae bacterium]|jgi:hypothetical protein